ncbi:MAG: type I restriction enzyme HsdR N-terminal domain-containing protein [Pseudomonadota bacterium]
MAVIPKKTEDRFLKSIGKFQNILKTAKDRDVNEADTVAIIGDILSEVFGYDKYLEVTSELCIHGTYCDLAIKIDSKIQFLIEAKAIGLELKDNHLRQAVDYGSKQGIQWVVLTNGILWQIYKIRFEQPISYDLVCFFNFFELNTRKTEDKDKLFIMCKEGLEKNARDEFHEKVQSINRFMIGALLLTDEMTNIIKRELKKISPNITVNVDEVKILLENEVMKRDVLEGDGAIKAKNRIKRFYGRAVKKVKTASDTANIEESVLSESEKVEGENKGLAC